MTVVLISGSGAITALFLTLSDGGRTVPIAVMLVPTLIGAITLAWNPSGRARDHQVLAGRFYQIASQITLGPVDAERLKKWEADVLGVLEDEPSTLHALNAECYNAATKAMNRKPRPLLRVNWYQHLLRNWWPFSPTSFRLVEPDSAEWPQS